MNEVPSLPIASVVVEYAFDLVLFLITDIVRVTPVFARQYPSFESVDRSEYIGIPYTFKTSCNNSLNPHGIIVF